MNHYEILGIENDADYKIIKKAFSSKVLLYHPDKQQIDLNNVESIKSNNEMFTKIQQAWECLRDSSTRSVYDAHLLEKQRQKFSISDEIDLDDMEYDELLSTFTYQCRCGGKYIINEEQLENGDEIASCNDCSLTIKVLYDSVADE